MNNFFYYLASFIVAIFLLLLGVICFFLPQSSESLKTILQFMVQNSWLLYCLSLLFITMGIVVLISIKLGLKKQHYHIKAGNRITLIDEKIFEQYLDTYWKELFPKYQIPSKATIKKNKLYVSADLPHIPLEEQKPLIQQIESDLNEILIKYLGYHHEYIVSINFEPEK